MACLLLALAGCAAQMAYRDGRQLTETGQTEQGLQKFEEAMRLDPQNIEYRATYVQTRERYLNAALDQADRLQSSGQSELAERTWRGVLVKDRANARAIAGLAALDRDQRHAAKLKDAAAALAAKDADTARALLTQVLAENPRNDAARAMLRDLDEKTLRPAPASPLAQAFRKPISLDFRDATLKQVFDVIAHSSQLSIIFDKDVKLDQRTSLFLKDSTIEAAVYYTLLTNQLSQQVVDARTILIYPNNPAKQKDYQEMIIKTFFLANVDAKTVANTLKTILKIRDVVVDEKLNLLIVRDSAEAIRLAEKLVATQDVAEPEVMLEVEVLEITHSRLTELGVTWPTSLTLTPLSGLGGTALTLQDLTSLNRGRIGAAIDPFKITARNQVIDTNILANPRIRAINHEKARIMIGNRVPNISTSVTATGIITESITYIDVGLKLEVEPTVYLDNDVAIKVGLEVSSIIDTQRSNAGTVTYTIGSRTASTTLRLKDGENQVLAGLINDQDRSSANRVPGLGSLPVAGRLFGSTLADGQKTEIVLSITPRLIRNIQRPEAAVSEYPSGTETSYRPRPVLAAKPVPVAAPAPAPAPAITPTPSPTPSPIPSATAVPSAMLAPGSVAVPATATTPVPTPPTAPAPASAAPAPVGKLN